MKTILVHVDSSHLAASRIGWACQLAAQQEARIEGLYVRPIPSMPVLPDGVPPSPELFQRMEQEIDEACETARARFAEAAGNAGRPFLWSTHLGDPAGAAAEAARYADLVVVGQDNPHEPFASPGVGTHVLLRAGRPVVILPLVPLPATTARRPMIAWNESPQAARAVRDSRELLRRAEQIDVVVGTKPGSEGTPPSLGALRDYLALYEIQCRTRSLECPDSDIAEVLMDYADTAGSDLMIMGGYGHSRMRELVLGGATREILHHTRIPTLLSH